LPQNGTVGSRPNIVANGPGDNSDAAIAVPEYPVIAVGLQKANDVSNLERHNSG